MFTRSDESSSTHPFSLHIRIPPSAAKSRLATTVTTASLSKFPDEILVMIIDFPDQHNDKELVALAQVSKRPCRLAQEKLYKFAVLPHEPDILHNAVTGLA